MDPKNCGDDRHISARCRGGIIWHRTASQARIMAVFKQSSGRIATPHPRPLVATADLPIRLVTAQVQSAVKSLE